MKCRVWGTAHVQNRGEEERIVRAGCDVRVRGRGVARVEVVAGARDRGVPHPAGFPRLSGFSRRSVNPHPVGAVCTFCGVLQGAQVAHTPTPVCMCVQCRGPVCGGFDGHGHCQCRKGWWAGGAPVQVLGAVAHAVDHGVVGEVARDGVLQRRVVARRHRRPAAQAAADQAHARLAVHLDARDACSKGFYESPHPSDTHKNKGTRIILSLRHAR